MKKMTSVFAIASLLVFASCDNNNGRYMDLRTGKEVELEKDEATGLMVDVETKKPVEIYVDTKSNDTIYGTTGKVINGKVIKADNGNYIYTDGGAYDYKSADGELKVEVEKDGDIKIKDGDSKIKIDGETGEKKVKND